jgi:hypothetical protein
VEKAYKHLIKWGLARKYTIEVECEGVTDYVGTNFQDAVDAVEACDIGTIYFSEPSNYIASFAYVLEYDQEPDESITDWGINDVTIDWDEDYTKHCYEYPKNNHYSRSNN